MNGINDTTPRISHPLLTGSCVPQTTTPTAPLCLLMRLSSQASKLIPLLRCLVFGDDECDQWGGAASDGRDAATKPLMTLGKYAR